jgi:hypothetical protein
MFKIMLGGLASVNIIIRIGIAQTIWQHLSITRVLDGDDFNVWLRKFLPQMFEEDFHLQRCELQ